MKKTLLAAACLLCSLASFADSYYFAWDGYGFCTHNNLSLTYGYGSYQYKGVAEGVGLGFMEINQKYDLFYNNDNGGSQGSSLRLKTNYYFLSPMAVFQLGKQGRVQCYITGGLGYSQGGDVEQHKWSSAAWSSAGQFDSTFDASTAMNTLVLRAGFGFAEFYPLGGNFHIFFNQDFGFLASSMVNSSDESLQHAFSNTSQRVQPMMFSLRVGIAFITHSRDSDNPYRIHASRKM